MTRTSWVLKVSPVDRYTDHTTVLQRETVMTTVRRGILPFYELKLRNYISYVKQILGITSSSSAGKMEITNRSDSQVLNT